MKKLLAIAALAATFSTPALADPLGDLIQFRTAEDGESCTRQETFAVCTLGKSNDYLQTYLTNGDTPAGTPAAAKDVCSKLVKADYELLTANFVQYYGGPAMLYCVHRKGAK